MNETWRAIPGYEGLYEVSSMGEVRSLPRPITKRMHYGVQRFLTKERLLQPIVSSLGYRRVGLTDSYGHRRIRQISHLVALAFIGPRPRGQEVCHCDGVRNNDAADNLRYDTRTGNQKDRILHGTSNAGSRNGRAKLTSSQVEEIISANTSSTVLSARYGVAPSTIRRIVRREIWASPPSFFVAPRPALPRQEALL
jgi:hypothetical protein